MVVMLVLIGFALYQTGESEAVEVGRTAPDFELTTLDGKTVRLSDFRGKGVLINFWASWCKPCRDEMPAIQRVYERHRDKGLEVLAVNIAETEVTVDGFVRHLDLTFPILLDPKPGSDSVVRDRSHSFFDLCFAGGQGGPEGVGADAGGSDRVDGPGDFGEIGASTVGGVLGRCRQSWFG